MTDADVRAESREGGVFVALSGEIDLANVEEVRVAVVRHVENTTWALVTDLSGLTYLDSAGVRLLFELAAKLGERRQELVVVAPPGSAPRDVLELVSIERVARLVDGQDEAVERVRTLRREHARE